MTRPPRPLREQGDNRVILDALGKFGERIDQLADHNIRADARREATDRENARAQADADARRDTLARELQSHREAQARDKSEVTATITEGWRKLDRKIDALTERVESVEARAPDIVTAADDAANKAITANRVEEQHTRSTMHRTTGLAIVGAGGAFMWGALNFATMHWKDIIGFLRWMGGAFSKLPPTG